MPGTQPVEHVVLLVEDEFLIRTEAASAFEKEGWSVLEACDADEALAIIHAQQPVDVPFTDVDLRSSLTGWDVAEKCRAHRANVAVFYASGVQRDHARRVQKNTVCSSTSRIGPTRLSMRVPC